MKVAVFNKPYIDMRAIAINNKQPLVFSLTRLCFCLAIKQGS